MEATLPRMTASLAKNLPGDLGKTSKRKERTVIGATNRQQHFDISSVSHCMPHEIQKATARRGRLEETQQHFKDVTAPGAELMMSDLVAKMEQRDQPAPLEGPSLPGHRAWPDASPLRTMDGSLTAAVKGGAVVARTQGPREPRQRGASQHESTRDRSQPAFAEVLAPTLRMGRSQYPDTRHITQPVTNDCSFYASESERFRTGVLDKFDEYTEDKARKARRDDFRVRRRREHEDRVQQTYAEEEAQKVLNSDNRALSRAYQRFKYLDRMDQVEKFRLGQAHRDRLFSRPADALDAWASASLPLYASKSRGVAGDLAGPERPTGGPALHASTSRTTSGDLHSSTFNLRNILV
eukprot:GGOE01004841.1.p1 GENE.GGOE01004841.1~~GGOE01004841.1.p1  ORF type:complete len:352 (+),score=68.26 GGOE01004841.1:61-1116(+)